MNTCRHFVFFNTGVPDSTYDALQTSDMDSIQCLDLTTPTVPTTLVTCSHSTTNSSTTDGEILKMETITDKILQISKKKPNYENVTILGTFDLMMI